MKNASELLFDVTALSIQVPADAAPMFSDHGAFEMPYLADFGLPIRYESRENNTQFFQPVRNLYPGFALHLPSTLKEFRTYRPVQ